MVANGQRKRAGAAGSWMGLSVSLRENARPSFWERPSQESCLQTLVGTLRFSGCSKSYPRTDVAASSPPRESSSTPSGRPVTSTHAAQGADGGHGIQ